MNNKEIVYQQNRQAILELIEQASFSSLEDFSLKSNISMLQISRLLYGLLPKMNIELFLKLSEFIKVPVHQLLILFYPVEEISPSLLEDLKSLNDYAQLRSKSQEVENTLMQERERFAAEVTRLEEQKELEKNILRVEYETSLNKLDEEKQKSLISYQNIEQHLELSQEKFKLDLEQMEANFNLEKESLKQEYQEELAKEKESLKQEYQEELAKEKESLKQEYEQLQNQWQQEKDKLKQEFQDATLQTLESLLIQLPTVTAAIQQNPEFPSVKLLPLFRPLPQLLKDWQIEAIDSVGVEVLYDPQYHQLLEGEAEIGDRVRVHYVGYKQGDRLLYKAKVSRVF